MAEQYLPIPQPEPLPRAAVTGMATYLETAGGKMSPTQMYMLIAAVLAAIGLMIFATSK